MQPSPSTHTIPIQPVVTGGRYCYEVDLSLRCTSIWLAVTGCRTAFELGELDIVPPLGELVCWFKDRSFGGRQRGPDHHGPMAWGVLGGGGGTCRTGLTKHPVHTAGCNFVAYLPDFAYYPMQTH